MPAGAVPLRFEGVLDLRAGYGSNPFLRQNSGGGSALVGGTLAGTLSRETARSKTSLYGSADIDQNFQHYGRTENYLTRLSQTQQISAKLNATADLSYQDSINPQTVPGDAVNRVDLLTIGQRTRRLAGDAGLDWQPTARDAFQLGTNASHSTYSGFGTSDYDQYGANAGYLRTLNARTKVGVQVSAVAVDSRRYPDSKSYEVGLQLVQQLSAAWLFNGSVGAIFQKSDGGGASLSTSLGFSGQLCGTYPRYKVCFTAARQSAPSGIGGLRTDLQGGVRVEYTLSARSRMNFAADVDDSKSTSITLPRERYYSASANYSHDINRRLAVGAGGRYQRRDIGNLLGLGRGSVDSYSVTADVILKFGRVSG